MARIIEIATPLDKDVLLFHTMRGTEEMSRLFEYQLELFSLDGEIDLDEMLGKGITVALERADGEVRYFNGLCSRISQGGKQGRFLRLSRDRAPLAVVSDPHRGTTGSSRRRPSRTS